MSERRSARLVRSAGVLTDSPVSTGLLFSYALSAGVVGGPRGWMASGVDWGWSVSVGSWALCQAASRVCGTSAGGVERALGNGRRADLTNRAVVVVVVVAGVLVVQLAQQAGGVAERDREQGGGDGGKAQAASVRAPLSRPVPGAVN